MKNPRKPLPGMLLTILTGCGPDPQKMLAQHRIPAKDVSWSEKILSTEPDLAHGRTLTLARAIEIALKHHPDGIALRSAAEAASARTGEALGSFWPQATLAGSEERATSNAFVDKDDLPAKGRLAETRGASGRASGFLKLTQGSDRSREGFKLEAAASQLVWDAGAARAAVREARHQAQAAALDWERGRQSIVFRVRQAYFTVLRNAAFVEVAEEALANFERHRAEAERLRAVGRGTPFDVTRAALDVSNATVGRIRADNDLALARAELNRSLGLEEDPGYLLEKEIPLSPWEIGFEESVAEARRQRPDLFAAETRLSASEAALRKVWAGYFPALSLTGTYGATGPKFPLVRNWGIGPSLEWNLFDGFRTTRVVEEAQAMVRKARAQWASIEQTLFLEVRRAWLGLQEAKERMALSDQTVQQAAESHRLAEERYRAGAGTPLEWADAQLALLRARAERIQARADHEVAAASLLSAIGVFEKGE